MKYTAIVLAGSRPGHDALAEQFGAGLKALIPICGEPMVRRPVRALLSTECVDRVIVMTQAADRITDVLPADERLSVRRSDGTIAATMIAMCDDSSVEWPLLVTTADHALLDSPTIQEFCSAAEGTDIAIGMVERRTMLQRLPGTRRTWLKFRGGAYTGANLFALSSPEVRPAVELWQSVEQDRKKAWRIMSLLGPAVLIAVALRLTSLDEVLANLSARLRLKVKAVRLSEPLAGIDVDKPADLALVEAVLKGEA